VIDVSFISLSLILPVAKRVLTDLGQCVPLVKPQFEAGRGDVGKGGVVRDPAIHRRVLVKSADTAIQNGFAVRGITRSPIVGPAGNIEFLMHLAVDEAEPSALDEMVDKALAE
jgi:23S rRNA (cytidine1920-2'-O)/16S rRNA (cytidine1409-2'-O)-methyltransferase